MSQHMTYGKNACQCGHDHAQHDETLRCTLCACVRWKRMGPWMRRELARTGSACSCGEMIRELEDTLSHLKAEHTEMRLLLKDFVRNGKLDPMLTACEMIPLAEALLARDQGYVAASGTLREEG